MAPSPSGDQNHAVDPGQQRSEVLPDLAWLVPVVLAVAATCVTSRQLGIVVPLLGVAAVPWVLQAVRRPPSSWLVTLAGIGPVLAILALDGLNASVFLATTALALLASRLERRWALAGLAVAGAALPFTSLTSRSAFDPGAFYFAIGNLFAIVVGMLLGHARRLDLRLRAADARLADVAAQRERTRLARDVHDLVAHSLTVVVLQVGGARRVLRADPGRAELALEQAERVARDSLDGIREVVGLLRSGDDAPGTMVDLLRLVETYRAAGVTVTLDTDSQLDGQPLLVRGTVYRIVQEALANAARYRTPDTPVTVRTTLIGDGVTVSVHNAVGSSVRQSGPGGYGLTGLSEQVSAIGGTLSSGPVGKHWVVECTLPLNVTARAGLAAR